MSHHTGISYNTKEEGLRLELNKIGLNLKCLASLSHVLCEENALKAIKIKSGKVEISQSGLKEDAANFQKLAGQHFISLDKIKYKIQLTPLAAVSNVTSSAIKCNKKTRVQTLTQ